MVVWDLGKKVFSKAIGFEPKLNIILFDEIFLRMGYA
jgi:hypothetical protein